MYFSIYTSSEYYNEDENDYTKTNNTIDTKDDDSYEKDICIICWMQNEENNQIKQLSDFNHIISTCNCNPKIHSICFNIWIAKTQSCPICRKKLTVNIIYSDNNNILIDYYFCCVETTIYFLKGFCFISFLNLSCLLIYNLYCFFILPNDYTNNDYYGAY
jgi:hypothetical protein